MVLSNSKTTGLAVQNLSPTSVKDFSRQGPQWRTWAENGAEDTGIFNVQEAAAKGKKVGNVGCFPVKGLYDRMRHPDFPDDARRPVVLKKPSLCPPRNEKDRPCVPRGTKRTVPASRLQ